MQGILIGIFFLLSSALVIAQTDDLTSKIASMEMESGRSHLAAGLRSSVPDNYDQTYQRCTWQVDPAIQYISGSVTTHFIPRAGGLSSIGFDLSLNLTVDSVVYHGQPLVFTHGGDDLLQTDLPIVLPGGVPDSITVYYQGAPLQEGFGTFVTETHNNTPVLWTLSEPYGAKHWWPCKQNLIDKIDSIDIFVQTPAAYQVASNGLLRSVTNAGSERVHHWQSRYPIPAYLVAIGVTNYEVYSDFVDLDGKKLEVLNYAYPENLVDWRMQSDLIGEMFQLFTEKAGTYPFIEEKYGHAQFGFGGGMEHQTMSFMVNMGYGLMAHELAHQWFGDAITCGSWQDIWLNEGFATYFEGLTREAYFPEQDWYNWKRAKLNSIVSQPGGSVFCTDTTELYRIFSGRLSYNKGAYVLHMLRFVLGDDVFFQAIRNYMNDPALRYGYARTPDLQAHFEAASGQNLDVFFDQWVYGEGFPSFELRWGTANGNWFCTVEQSTSIPAAVQQFDIPLPVGLYGPNLDTVVVVNGSSASIQLPFAIDSVAIDPNLQIISANNTVVQVVGTASPGNASSAIGVYPNPGTDQIWLDVPAGSYIRMFDAFGRLVLEGNYDSVGLRVQKLPAGVYILEIEMPDKQRGITRWIHK